MNCKRYGRKQAGSILQLARRDKLCKISLWTFLTTKEHQTLTAMLMVMGGVALSSFDTRQGQRVALAL
jgi:hypothetical protein